ncbi:MAG: hypothetical protein IT381_03045 [Deltaproteobacteria bacterium]|nr:hypothetical protein [Deltaproteobacteria bacterium]
MASRDLSAPERAGTNSPLPMQRWPEVSAGLAVTASAAGAHALFGARVAALAQIHSASTALSPPGASAGLYPGHDAHFNFDCFSNEPGLAATLDKLTQRGGAAIGVSGSIFDVAAAIEADLLVSVDQNPAVREVTLLLSAVLLLVDGKGSEHGWDAPRRAREVLHRLLPAALCDDPHATLDAAAAQLILDESATVAKELTEAGLLPTEQQQAATELLTSVAMKLLKSPQTLWCRGPGAPEKVAHLSRLARDGRIVAITTDLGAADLGPKLSSLLRERRAQATAFNLSNAFDYIADVSGVCQTLATLPRSADAVVVTSTTHLDFNLERGTQKDQLIQSLGSFQAPAASPADAWLQPGGLGAELHAAIWQAPRQRRALLGYVNHRTRVSDPETLEVFKDLVERGHERAGRTR